MAFGPAAETAIHWISAPTSLLSFFCSATICYHVTRHRQRQSYHRLMLGLSIYDIVSSGTIFAARFGDITTPGPPCSAIAVLQIWSVGSAMWYNVWLTLMFLLIVNYNVKDENIVKYCETPAHLISSICPIALCIAGHFLEVWNPVTFTAVCWVGKYPANCEGDECIRGGEWYFFYDKFVHALFYLSVLFLIVANGLIFWHVHKTVTRNRRYSQPLEAQRRRSSVGGSATGRSSKDNRARKVAKRSFLYCGGFVCTYIFTVLQTELESESAYGTWWYVTISILSSIFWPLQGFFDSLIFFHPRYNKWRRANPERRWWFALYMTMCTTQAPIEQRFHTATISQPPSTRSSFWRRSTLRRSSVSQAARVCALEVGNIGDDDVLQRNEHCTSSAVPDQVDLWGEVAVSAFTKSEEDEQPDDDIAVFG